MTPTSARALQALAALLLLLPALPMPTASAVHLAGAADEDPPEVPQVPGGPAADTGVIPVDQTQRDAADAANDGVNRTEPLRRESDRQANEALNETPLPGFITLLSDGFGPGERKGGFGDWELLDNAAPVDAWQVLANNGTVQGNGVLAKGHYPSSADTVLVSPEIDLATGFVDPMLGVDSPELEKLFADVAGIVNPVLGQGLPVGQDGAPVQAPQIASPDLSLSAVYRLVFAELDFVANTGCYVAAYGCWVGGESVTPVDAETREGAFILEVERRLNLAAGRDGVQVMAFTSRPTLAKALDCRPATDDPDEAPLALEAPLYNKHMRPRNTCALLRPLERDPGVEGAEQVDAGVARVTLNNDPLQPMERFNHELAYTGYDAWQTDYFDLTPWGGGSVWIGFYFSSGNAVGDPYFDSPAFFQPGAGFWGFQVGSVNITAPAPEHNVRLRPLVAPVAPPETPGISDPTIALGKPIPVAVDVVNMGTRSVVVDVVARLLRPSDDATLHEVLLGNLSLDPGVVKPLEGEILGFTAAPTSYRLEVQALTTSTPAKTGDADLGDNVRSVLVDVKDFSLWVPRAAQRSSPTIPLDGGVETITLPLENLGNVPATVTARATVVDAVTRLEVTDDVASIKGSPTLTEDLAPFGEDGANKNMTWQIVGKVAGQYHLFISLNDEASYDAAKDFRPSLLPPTAAAWLPRGPTLGGGASTAEWSSDIPIQLHDLGAPREQPLPGTLRLANNATHLFVALSLEPENEPDAFGLFFDDKGDGMVVPGQEDGLIVHKSGASWGLLDVAHADPTSAHAEDLRLSRLAGTATAYQEVGAGPDAGDVLRILRERTEEAVDRDRNLITIHANAEGPIEPRELFLDLDYSGTVSAGDYQLASLDPRHAGQDATFVLADDRRTGFPLRSGIAPRNICFLEGPAGFGREGFRDPGEPIYFVSGETCGSLQAGDFRLSPYPFSTPPLPGGKILADGDPEIGPPGLSAKAFPLRNPQFRWVDADDTGQVSAGDRIYLKVWPLAWRPDTGPSDWTFARSVETPSGNVTYELRGPLKGAAGDLKAEPGDALSLVLSFLDSPSEHRWPPAAIDDGHGLQAANGNLGDETDAWMRLSLAKAAGTPTVASTYRELSLGFGIDRSPPVVLAESLDDCALPGWTQTAVMPEDRLSPRVGTLQVEKWNCGAYGADGKTRLYEGWSQDALCDGAQCPPWSGALQQATRGPSQLVSPPILMPEIPDPYLVVRHQFSTDARINDESPFAPGVNGVCCQLSINSVARVLVQEWDSSTKSWKDAVPVRPLGGYSSEESVGIAKEVGGARWAVGALDFCPQETFTGNRRFIDFPCGWWWPTGYQSLYQVPGEPIATGAAFSGSPWQVDRLPLFGYPHGLAEDQTLFLAGKQIRFIFEFYPAAGPVDPTAEHPADYGWRIEGFAITEGPTFAKDVGIDALSVYAPLYDATSMGLGPATTATINVTVANSGSQAASGLSVCLSAIDLSDPGASPDCQEHVLDGLVLAPGQKRDLALPFEVPDRPGTQVSLRASIAVATGDDFLANNDLATRESFPIREVRDAAVFVDALPRIGAPTTPRTLLVVVENRGNVPLTDFKVERSVTFLDGASGSTVLPPRSWTVEGTLGIGESRSLALLDTAEPLAPQDLRLPAPRRNGSFVLVGSVDLEGDQVASNDLAVAPFRALDALYSNPFEPASTALAGTVMNGTEAWGLQPGSHDGTQRLVAQDPDTREIPVLADSIIQLPPIDLGSAKTASLTFRHRYDLEETFDSGRVEVSTDGGQTWRVLQPVANLQTPTGYPDVSLSGTSPLVSQADPSDPLRAVAYTGRSDEQPGATTGGWLDAEFDLSHDPGLARSATLDRFTLTGMRPLPDDEPILAPTGDQEFRARGGEEAADWTLDGDSAEATQRYWWIQNLTHDDPRPHSGDQMWWSGTAGENSPEDRQEAVKDRLEFAFTAPGLPATPASRTLLTWWEWRSGWTDGGTGGRFGAEIVGQPGRQILEIAQEPSGWRQLGIDVAGLSGPQTLRLDYDSVATADFQDPAREANLGWFVDDLQLMGYGYDQARRLLHSPAVLSPLVDLEGAIEGFTSTPLDGSPVRWTIVGAGAAARDGGWHVAELDVPGQGTTSVWRFASDNDQGYPHLAESRLVTPRVDLGLASGDLTLRFDHRYWFESRNRCPFDQVSPSPQDLSAWQAAGCFRSAVDAGAVEVQVYDAALGTFGPWQQLGAQPTFPNRLLIEAQSTPCDQGLDTCVADVLTNVEGNRGRIRSTGYSAIEEHGSLPRSDSFAEGQCRLVELGMGTGSRFERQPGLVRASYLATNGECSTGLEPWAPYPMSYVFSGGSAGVEGWEPVAWDISRFAGQQVRFAFHAFTNPGYVALATDPDDPDRRGWSIANVAVEGDAFAGKEILLRLRVSTDSSLPAGEWSLDNVVVAGERYEDNAALLSQAPLVRAAPGTTVRLEGDVTNLGQRSRSGMALGLTALDEKTLTPFDGDLLDSEGVRIVSPGSLQWLDARLPPGVTAAFSVPTLPEGARLPVAVEVDLPDSQGTVLLRWTLLQVVGTESGGSIEPRYEPLAIEEPGNVVSSWRAVAVVDPEFTLETGVPGRSGAMLVQPDAPAANKAVQLRTVLSNAGTTVPDEAVAEWTAERVIRKASPQQPNSGNAESDEVASATVPIGVFAQGATQTLWFNFTPEQAGLYRATLRVLDGSEVLVRASKEFLVSSNGTYYTIDFTRVDAKAAGWQDESPDPTPNGGGSTDAIRFRDLGDRFAWGVTEDQLASDITYCDYAQCNFAATQNNNAIPPEWTAFGLEGIAVGPPIDLTRVPDGRAFATLRHDVGLEAGDGARLEFLPLDHRWSPDDEQPRAVFECGAPDGGGPMRFYVQGRPLDQYASVEGATGQGHPPIPVTGPVGQRIPHRVHPMAPEIGRPQDALGGLVPEATTRFDLGEAARSHCRDGSGNYVFLELTNYTVLPVLHVGTLPGYTTDSKGSEVRQGAQGWGITSVHVSSSSLELVPSSQRYALQGGSSKDFVLTVRNSGEVADVVEFLLDENTSTLPSADWVKLPAPVALAPGEERRVVFTIRTATGAIQPGIYAMDLVARSTSDRSLTALLDATVEVVGTPLPDLDVRVATEAVGEPPLLQADTFQTITATVVNTGNEASRPAPLVLEVARATNGVPAGPFTTIAEALVPELPAHSDPFPLAFEWTVASEPGEYLLRVSADPSGRLIEQSLSNNVRQQAIRVVPNDVADPAVSLRVEGLRPNGVAEEGTLLTLVTEVKNLGSATAPQFDVQLRLDSKPLGPKITIPSLGAGATINTSLQKAFTAGDHDLRADLTPGGDDGVPGGPGSDNNNFRLTLRVIGHAIEVKALGTPVPLVPGSPASVILNVTNGGNSPEKVSLSLDPSLAGWRFQAPNPISVVPGQSLAVATTIIPPPDAAAGTRNVTVLATRAGHATPSRHGIEMPIESRSGAPLIHASSSATAPGALEIPVRLDSTGNVPYDLTATLASPAWPSEAATVRLPAGGNATALLDVTVPSDTPPGRHTLEVRIAGAGTEPLAYTFELEVLPGPSLASAWSGAVRTAAPSLGLREVTYALRLANDGNVPVRPEVRLRDLPAGMTAAAIDAGGLLAPGEERLVDAVVAMPASAPEAIVGRADVWLEAGGPLRLARTLVLPALDAAPDLRVASIEVTPRSGHVAGQPIRLSAIVTNHGDVEAPASVLYASANGYLVRPIEVPPVPAGASVPVNLTVAFDEPGSVVLSLMADGEGNVAETHDDDNGLNVVLEVAKPGLDDRLRGAPSPGWAALAALCLALALASRRRRSP